MVLMTELTWKVFSAVSPSVLVMFEAFVKLAQEKFAVSSWKPNTGQWDLTGFYLIFITDFDFDQSLKEKFLYSKTKGRKEKKKWVEKRKTKVNPPANQSVFLGVLLYFITGQL